MNREFLESLELDKEQVDKIMKEHGKTIQTVKSEDEERETTIATLESQLQKRDEDFAELKKNTKDGTELQEQLDSLSGKYEEETTDLQTRLAEQKKQSEIRLGITKAGARNEKAVMALLNNEEVRIDDDGVHGLKDQIIQLQESDPYLFVSENEPSGQSVPPGNPQRKGKGETKSAFAKAAEKYTKK